MQNDTALNFKSMLDKSIKKSYPTLEFNDAEIEYSIVLSIENDRDISSSIAFRIANLLKRSPKDIAEQIATNMESSKLIEEISTLNGYINAKLSVRYFSEYVLNEVITLTKLYGSSNIGKGKTALIEYPSVNPNKPWHVGHTRNPLIGDSISKILKFCSYSVMRVDYIEDLGLQMAEILWGRKHLQWEQKEKKYDQFLGEKYVEINRHMKDQGVEDEIKALLKKMENTSSLEAKEIREISSMSVMAQYETAFNYGIYHDLLLWESDILNEKLLEKTMQLLNNKNIVEKKLTGKLEGCVVIKKTSDEDGNVLLRSNGVPTYLAKDIAFHMWKLGIIQTNFKIVEFIKQPDSSYAMSTAPNGEELKFKGADLVINIIGSAQNEPQNVLKNTLKLIDEDKATSLIHISYGEISLKEGKISGRSGTWLGNERNYTADDLLKTVTEKALEIMISNDKLSKDIDIKISSKLIALAAIKFDFLRIDPIKKLVFDWDRALDFNSNSGPYCLYMYARACKILDKAGYSKTIKVDDNDFEKIQRDQGFELIKLISKSQSIVLKAAKEYKPSIIAEYCMELSILFGKFYENINVLNSGDQKQLLLAIVYATKQTLYNMLMLLGITPLSSM